MPKKEKSHGKPEAAVKVGAGTKRKKRGIALSLNRILALVFIVAFGGIGAYLLISSFADTVRTSLGPDAYITTGQQLVSPDGGMKLKLQTDGNLVLYNRANAAIWNSGTKGQGAVKLLFVGDSHNLVLRNNANSNVKIIANTSTAVKFNVQNNANMVLLDKAGSEVWTSNTANKQGSFPPAKPAAPVTTLKVNGATSATVNNAANVTLSWSSTNSPTCSASGAWGGSKAASGSATVNVGKTAGTLTYTLKCTNAGGSDTASVPVTVKAPSTSGGSTTPTATYDHNPYGYADSCALVNGVTTLYGWAHDVDEAKGPQTHVQVSVTYNGKKVTTEVPTDVVNYRDTAINNWIKTYRSNQPAGKGEYGWKAQFKGVYRGTVYKLSGVVLNVDSGGNQDLRVNTSRHVDNSTKPYFVNSSIPDACLPTKPAGAKQTTPTPVGSQVVAAPATQAAPTAVASSGYSNSNGVYEWSDSKDVSFENGKFTVSNGSYILAFTGDNLVETHNGKQVWSTKLTPISYPDNPKAKHGELVFDGNGKVKVVDPNTSPGKSIWNSVAAQVGGDNKGYHLQLTQCGGVYVYQRQIGVLVGGKTVVSADAKNTSCSTTALATNNRLFENSTLFTGMSLNSVDGSTRLELRTDGLHLFNKNKEVWKQSVANTNRLVMRPNGNLAVYGTKDSKALWSTNVQGDNGSYAVVDNGGYFAIKNVTTKNTVTLWSNGITPATCTTKHQDVTYPASGAIVCKTPAKNAPKTTAKAAPAPCKSIGGGKFNCEFSIPARVVNSKGQLQGSFVYATTNWITCQQQGTKEVKLGSAQDKWWGYTLSDNGGWGWVSAVYAKGGDNDGGFKDVPNCNGKHGKTPTDMYVHYTPPNPNQPAPRHAKGHTGGQGGSGGGGGKPAECSSGSWSTEGVKTNGKTYLKCVNGKWTKASCQAGYGAVPGTSQTGPCHKLSSGPSGPKCNAHTISGGQVHSDCSVTCYISLGYHKLSVWDSSRGGYKVTCPQKVCATGATHFYVNAPCYSSGILKTRPVAFTTSCKTGYDRHSVWVGGEVGYSVSCVKRECTSNNSFLYSNAPCFSGSSLKYSKVPRRVS